MRIECPHCSELVPAQVEELGNHAVIFRCGACDTRIEVVAALKASHGELSQVEPKETGMQCPKCAARIRSNASACQACGLATKRFTDFESIATSIAGSDEFETAWSKLLGDWHNEGRHEAFVEQMVSLADYKEGARRYREAAAVQAQAAKATSMLARIRSMAAAALLTTRPKVAKTQEPFRAVPMLLIALVVLAGGLYVTMKTKEQASERKFPQFRTVTPANSGTR